MTPVPSDGWRGRRVLVTGHTGFKGSWLSLWLRELGAQVTGFALPAATDPSLFEQAGVGEVVDSILGDVRDLSAVTEVMAHAQPEVVFHLAAQPLVRASYDQPVETYATNVMGTVHLLEAARHVGGVNAFVCITTDKCYENQGWVWPYRESDPMGGHDPYSSSKGCAELVVAAYRRSFFGGSNAMHLASVRAGNVIGGGDYAVDRLVPDLIRSFEAGQPPVIRSPASVRPWQHVLEAIGGYLMLAERLLQRAPGMAEAWNFGPSDDDARPVSWIVERMHAAWGNAPAAIGTDAVGPHEAALLRLDISKARAQLGWRPSLGLHEAIDWIVDWHRRVANGENARSVTLEQIGRYAQVAAAVGVPAPLSA